MLVYAILLLGCLLLYLGGDWLLEGVTELGARMGWPKAITGLLLVSLGTSAPELFVSVGSALQGHGAMAAGNVIGSNIINMAIVLGLAACVAILAVERLLQQQLLALLLITVASAVMLHNQHVSRLEGLILLIATAASFAFAFKRGLVPDNAGTSIKETHRHDRTLLHCMGLTVGGVAALLVGAEALIHSGIALAERFHVPESVIALTVTSLGTSLPEIAATVVAVFRRETSLAVGNVIGSNLLNLGLVMGLSAVVAPLQNTGIGTLTVTVFVGLTLLITVLGIKPAQYQRWAGMLLILSYVAYTTALLTT